MSFRPVLLKQDLPLGVFNPNSEGALPNLTYLYQDHGVARSINPMLKCVGSELRGAYNGMLTFGFYTPTKVSSFWLNNVSPYCTTLPKKWKQEYVGMAYDPLCAFALQIVVPNYLRRNSSGTLLLESPQESYYLDEAPKLPVLFKDNGINSGIAFAQGGSAFITSPPVVGYFEREGGLDFVYATNTRLDNLLQNIAGMAIMVRESELNNVMVAKLRRKTNLPSSKRPAHEFVNRLVFTEQITLQKYP